MRSLLLSLAFISLVATGNASDLLVEAESFEKHGGWKLDTQSIPAMGSPYLLAHGMGRPVDDATTTVIFPETGTYHVLVRTYDWVARWDAPGDPGRFQVLVNGTALKPTFGKEGDYWGWHDGGTIEVKANEEVTLALHDLTGFDGRCDSIYFTTTENAAPPNEMPALDGWRKKQLGLPEVTPLAGDYDLVVVGGGYSGMGAAISAARMGCEVALIQNRPVLGGNGSSEVRVWAQGLIRRGRFPRIGEIISEFADNAKASPGKPEAFGDALKERIVRAEPLIDLYLNHHADKVIMDGEKIAAVEAFDTRTSRRLRFEAPLFADCTGHGVIGALAGADFKMLLDGHMGMSNMWRWEKTDTPQDFPEIEWALNLTMQDFPYPKRQHGEWFWESGFNKNPIQQAEAVRDWNLRAVLGAWNAMKNKGGAAEHENARLVWIAFIGGPRESRRLMGDAILSKEDVVNKVEYPDGTVPSTWSIDLHYPKKRFADKFPENPFISIAEFDARVDRSYGYPIPYRCFYSRNVPNLFMAGRCISVTHEALGTTRVMKTCGMMGEVVGKAAAVCIEEDCQPRDVYKDHLKNLFALLELPGKARRLEVGGKTVIPDDALPKAPHYRPTTEMGVDPASLTGVVIDDRDANFAGPWHTGAGLDGYIGYGYHYAGSHPACTVTFKAVVPANGAYELRYAWQPHPNRASNAKATVIAGGKKVVVPLNLRAEPPIEGGWGPLGQFTLQKGATVRVTLATKGANGNVHVDAIWLKPAP